MQQGAARKSKVKMQNLMTEFKSVGPNGEQYTGFGYEVPAFAVWYRLKSHKEYWVTATAGDFSSAMECVETLKKSYREGAEFHIRSISN